jgi:hypothetical protein
MRGMCIGTFILMNNLFFFLHWRLLRFTTAAKMKQVSLPDENHPLP